LEFLRHGALLCQYYRAKRSRDLVGNDRSGNSSLGRLVSL